MTDADILYLVKQGKEFFKRQAYKQAEAVFLRLLSHNREFADVYNMLGVINHQTGQFSEAISYFKKALKINPLYTEALLNLSVLYNDIGDYKLSRQLLGRSKKKSAKGGGDVNPFVRAKLANKHAELGDLYRGVGLYGRAVEEFEKALGLAPHFYDIRNRLGICLREEGKKQEALREFERISKEKSTYVDARIQMGITLYTMGKKKEARHVWEKLVHEFPRHELVRMYLRLSDESRCEVKSRGRRQS